MGGISLLGAVFTLILVLALAYWCSRFLGSRWNHVAGNGKKIHILEQIPIGTDKRLLLIRYGEKEYLLGAAQGGFTLIASQEAELNNTELSEPPKAFSQILRARFGREERKGDRNE